MKSAEAPRAVDVVGMGTVTMHYEALVPQKIEPRRKYHGQGYDDFPGGGTAMALTQLARLGVSCSWLGILGADSNGERLKQYFVQEGIETRCLKLYPDRRSPFSWVMVTPEGDRTLFYFPNILGDLTPEEVSATMVGCIDNALHFHTDIATIPFQTTLQAIEVAAAADCMIFTDVDSDPLYLIEEVGLGRRKELEAILAKSDVLKVCRLAALRLTGAADLETACRQLHETCGARYVAVTMGREGSLLAGNGTLWHIPVLGPPAVDPTGAGGAYFGGLSYAILHGMQGVDAGLFASACAAVACSHMGGEGIGRLNQIQQMLATGADQAQFTGDDNPAGS